MWQRILLRMQRWTSRLGCAQHYRILNRHHQLLDLPEAKQYEQAGFGVSTQTAALEGCLQTEASAARSLDGEIAL